MSGPGAWWGRLRAAPERLRGRWEGRPLVLMYHRVAVAGADPWKLAVTPAHFAEHLEVIRRHLRPLPLRRLAEGAAPRHAAVVTFDDGYADNLTAARPLLERHDVSATVFVVSGAVGRPDGFWWDRLAALLLEGRGLPAGVEVEAAGERIALDLRGEPSPWSAADPPPAPRHAAYLQLSHRLRRLESAEREAVLVRLAAALGASPAVEPAARPLSETELRALADGDLVEVGAHTVTHPELAALSLAGQEREVRGCRSRLEELVGRPVLSFSYPFGGRGQYTADTVRLVREAGFTRACTTAGGSLPRPADPFRLPRIHVPDCDGEAFSRLLSRWTALPRRPR